jgi:hypothetical protein
MDRMAELFDALQSLVQISLLKHIMAYSFRLTMEQAGARLIQA